MGARQGDGVENALRDDLAQARRALHKRDAEILHLRAELQLARAQSEQQQQCLTPCLRVRACLLLVVRRLCPCCVRRPTALLLAEHTSQLHDEATPTHVQTEEASAATRGETTAPPADDTNASDPSSVVLRASERA